ncbi:MAG TPA: hypothetical protein VNN80_35255 [Polyangiaceae bacterium]|nr:hypothetical protein [Polyangiaceae bacterium]
MAKQRTSAGFFFLMGFPTLIQAWVRWGEHPLSGWFYTSAVSGVALVAMGVMTIWVQRNQASAAGTGPSIPKNRSSTNR